MLERFSVYGGADEITGFVKGKWQRALQTTWAARLENGDDDAQRKKVANI